jgi:hypothetical protein
MEDTALRGAEDLLDCKTLKIENRKMKNRSGLLRVRAEQNSVRAVTKTQFAFFILQFSISY